MARMRRIFFNRLLVCGVISLVFLPVSNVLASIPIGEAELTPSLTINYGSTDNVFREAENTENSSGVVVSPALSYKATRRLLSLEAAYKGSFGQFSEAAANFNDHSLSFRSDAEISSKHRASLSFFIKKFHEGLGLGQTRDSDERQGEQIESLTTQLAGSHTYGSVGAKGNVRIGLAIKSTNFSNLEELTEGDDQLVVTPSIAFSYGVSLDTRIVSELRISQLNFDDDLRDRIQISALLGLEFQPTGKLGGAASVGIVEASYANAEVSDANNLIVEIDMNFQPLSYSEIAVTYTRGLETLENNGLGSLSTIRDSAKVDWTHQWSGRFSTTTGLNVEAVARECPLLDTTELESTISLNYQARRWLEFGIGGSLSSRDTSSCVSDGVVVDSTNDFDRTTYSVQVKATF
jgi:hypothetical protein